MLDLSTVGPGARCTRILADYGARGGQDRRAAEAGRRADRAARSGPTARGRGMQQVRIDLKAPAGKAAFLRARRAAPTSCVESYRPGVVARLGIGYEDVRAREPAHRLLLDLRLRAERARARGWAGHDLNYLAVGGFLHAAGRARRRRAAAPGRHRRRQRGRRHARGARDPRGAAARASARGEGEYLDVAVAEGVLSLMSLCDRRAPRDRREARRRATTC